MLSHFHNLFERMARGKGESERWRGQGIRMYLDNHLELQLSKPFGEKLTPWLDSMQINIGKMAAAPWWLNLPSEKIANSGGKLIIFCQFPKEEKMILKIFNPFIGKTMKAKLMIIRIGPAFWKRIRFDIYFIKSYRKNDPWYRTSEEGIEDPKEVLIG